MPRVHQVLLILLIRAGFLYHRADETFTTKHIPKYYTVITTNVRVQEGLCVLIPCEFYYQESDTIGSTPRGDWYVTGEGLVEHHQPVATNVDNIKVKDSTHGRFKFVGDLWNHDCSMRIDDAKKEDTKSYYFMFYGNFKITFRFDSSFVTVTDLTEKPTISLASEFSPGVQTILQCTAPGRCKGTPPNIIWKGSLNTINITNTASSPNENGEVTYESNFFFTPYIKDEGETVICLVYYPAVRQTVQRTISINFPETTTAITTTISTTTTTRSTTVRSPRSTTTVRGPSSTSSLIPGTTSEDKPGPEDWPKSRDWLKSNCKEQHEGISCTCWIQSNPPPELRWLINEEIVAGNFSNNTVQMFSVAYGQTANSTLTLRDTKAGTINIHCLNANKGSAFKKIFGQLDFGILILIICGSVLFIFLTALPAFYCGKKIKLKKKELDESETAMQDDAASLHSVSSIISPMISASSTYYISPTISAPSTWSISSTISTPSTSSSSSTISSHSTLNEEEPGTNGVV